MMVEHISVLFQEVLDMLQPQPGGCFIDGTLGAGGHTTALLQASAPNGRVMAFDRDPEAIAYCQQRLTSFNDRIHYVNASFAEMATVVANPTTFRDKSATAGAKAVSFSSDWETGFKAGKIDAILLDLGLSSRQLADGDRGFSFLKEGPLDMRFSPQQTTTAADLINRLSGDELANIFWQYGEEKHSRRLARAICDARPLTTTTQLATLIAAKMPRSPRKRPSQIHPATRIFQALRIAVNEELAALTDVIEAAVSLLRAGGRLGIISFHSLEDRIVKQKFRSLSRDCICPPEQIICNCRGQAIVRLITKKPVRPLETEVAGNARSRSARFRVAEKLPLRGVQ